MKNKKLTALLMLVFLFAGSAFSAARIVDYPRAVQKAGENMIITWDDGTGLVYNASLCEFVYGPGPSNYTGDVTENSAGLLDITPSSQGMSGGAYYCRISPTGADTMSREFRISIDDSSQVINYTAPANNEVLSTVSPVFQWQKISGVPYYTIFVFEEEPELQTGSGGTTLNVNIVWAAITDGTSIQYGTPDPAGFYDGLDAPPLTQGITYAWAVIKNYSGTPAMLSESFPVYRKFTAAPLASCGAPVLLSPADSASMTDTAEIVLSWEAVSGASSYKVMLKRTEDDVISISGNQKIPFWTAETAGTSVTVPADIKMNSNDYEWYVMAIDSAGKGAKSETGSFYYENTADLNFNITVQESVSGLGNYPVPGAVFYIKTTYGANVNAYPFVADNEGVLYYYLEAGEYEVIVKKTEFDTAVFSLSLAVDGQAETWTLVRSVYSVRGTVEDDSGINVSGALINAALQGTTFTASASSLADGSFIFGAGNTNGDWDIVVSKAGYETAAFTEAVPPGSLEHVISGPVVLTRAVNTLSGQVTNNSAQGINGALVTAEASGNPSDSFSVYTDASGNYSMQLPDANWIVNAVKAGFISPSPSSVSLSGGESKTLNFTLSPESNEITGNVSESGGGSMDGVLVKAVPSGGGPALQTYTDAFGNYSISAGTGLFEVNAFKSGYTSDGGQVVNFGTAGGQVESGVDFIMTSSAVTDDAGLYVYTGYSGADLEGVAVYIDGNEAATTGYSGYGVTDSYGGVTFTAMHPGNYDIQLTKAGYTAINLSTGSPLVNDSIVTESFVMTADAASPGTISGTAKEGTGGVPGVVIEIYEQAAPETLVASETTNASGGYSVSVAPGDYTVKALMNGYSVSPAQNYVTAASSAVTGAHFILSQPDGGTITVVLDPSAGIDMYSDVYNTNIGGPWPYPFKAVFEDQFGQNVQAEFTWSVQPPEAGIITGSGILTPTADYIGEVSVIAEALNVKGSVKVPVYQYFTPSYPASDKTIKDYRGFSFFIPAGSAGASNSDSKFTVIKKDPSGAMALSSGKKAVSSIYDMTYGISTDLGFDSAATITMPYTGSYDEEKVKAGKWNDVSLSWNSLGGTAAGTKVSAGVSALYEFAVITELGELGIPSISFSPNPFSPYNGGVTISYMIDSLRGANIRTTIKIYNIAGRLVAVPIDGELRSAGSINYDVWDGRDLKGNWAKNGRYLVNVEVEDTGSKKSYVYSVVLIK